MERKNSVRKSREKDGEEEEKYYESHRVILLQSASHHPSHQIALDSFLPPSFSLCTCIQRFLFSFQSPQLCRPLFAHSLAVVVVLVVEIVDSTPPTHEFCSILHSATATAAATAAEYEWVIQCRLRIREHQLHSPSLSLSFSLPNAITGEKRREHILFASQFTVRVLWWTAIHGYSSLLGEPLVLFQLWRKRKTRPPFLDSWVYALESCCHFR